MKDENGEVTAAMLQGMPSDARIEELAKKLFFYCTELDNNTSTVIMIVCIVLGRLMGLLAKPGQVESLVRGCSEHIMEEAVRTAKKKVIVEARDAESGPRLADGERALQLTGASVGFNVLFAAVLGAARSMFGTKEFSRQLREAAQASDILEDRHFDTFDDFRKVLLVETAIDRNRPKKA